MSDASQEIEYIKVDPDDEDRVDTRITYHRHSSEMSPEAASRLKALMEKLDAEQEGVFNGVIGRRIR